MMESKGGPTTHRPPGPAVDHQIVGSFGHRRRHLLDQGGSLVERQLIVGGDVKRLAGPRSVEQLNPLPMEYPWGAGVPPTATITAHPECYRRTTAAASDSTAERYPDA